MMSRAGLSIIGLLLAAVVCPAQVTFNSYPLPAGYGNPRQLATGRDGNLWFTNDPGIGRITRDGNITEFPISVAGAPCTTCEPFGITALGDYMWFVVVAPG